MKRNSKLVKATRNFYQKLCSSSPLTIKEQSLWLLRAFLVTRKQPEWVNAGFVLPTVAMVALVVVLLTTAILFRSFERSKNATNVRVNEAVIKAATPALDRAKAKINELFADPSLPRAVPSNSTLYNTLVSKLKVYTLGDETPLTLTNDIDTDKNYETNGSLENRETLETAWKFPVDTDNNGLFDSFTLYGIYFRNPPQSGVTATRSRIPLDARTPPMLPAKAGTACDAEGDTSASLVGSSGWYKLPTGELKKSFFVYAVTVPITDISNFDSTIKGKYETYRGTKGFSAIELQQDPSQLPITNNAVVYEDDLDITPGTLFRLNGRIFTNSNLMMKQVKGVMLFQVSSKNSCYYERENGKILVGGNVAGGGPVEASDPSGVEVHLFKENGEPTQDKLLASSNKSTSNAPNEVAYNSQAYAQRIDLLVKAQALHNKTSDPDEVKDNITRRTKNDPGLDPDKVRLEALEVYFKKRTRRVPFKEVPYGTSGIINSGSTDYTTTDVLQGYDNSKSSNALRPPDKWMYPLDANTKLTLNKSELPAHDPEVVEKSPIEEKEFGDRILVGNNLPELRWDDSKKEFVGEEVPQDISGEKWKNSSKIRTRTTRVRQLDDLGMTGRDGFWEASAATPRVNNLDVVGGLRVITGAGVYSSASSNLPTPPPAPDNSNTTPEKEDKAPVVWPDTMPMLVPDPADPTNASKQTRGHLVMRATAVYHYNKDAYDPVNAGDNYQTPVACVSSYYNPTNLTTATTDGYDPLVPSTANRSNNGFSYGVSSTKAENVTRGQTKDSNGLFTTTASLNDVTDKSVSLLERLKYQANLVFPNGRFVNPLLRQALAKATDKPLTLSEQAALDSTICALQIADGTLKRDTSVIPNDAIKETTFLDARQIKAIDSGSLTGTYNLEIEQRQPLEIRATVIDLDDKKLRKTAITGTWSNEYLLPNSGIIYATRDDAQQDASDPSSDNVSATDYKLDPNRRPSAIMLINGKDLSREKDYRPEEKGLILATNLQVYVKGDFNEHKKQEFKGSDTLSSPDDWDSKFYPRSDRDSDFACRPKDPRLPKCTTGESWRPASIIADAVTLLSENFLEGSRTDGDYDLRNNQEDANGAISKRLKKGFWDNNFVTTRNFQDSDYSGNLSSAVNSSYFNNFVTPIQRRATFPEYVMEMCYKLTISECGAGDWYVGIGTDKTKKSSDIVASTLTSSLIAGTTAKPPQSGYERFPRRVAFKRTFVAGSDFGKLVKSDGTTLINLATERPLAIGVKSDGTIDFQGTASVSQLNKPSNTLWFTTTTTTTAKPADSTKNYGNSNPLFYKFPSTDLTDQPLLEPILQIQVTKENPKDTANFNELKGNAGEFLGNESHRVKNTRWLPKAKDTTFNLVIAAGDTPSRVGNVSDSLLPQYYERNGGLHNFVRFLENWDKINANIAGSFIQFKRSIFTTAPYQVFVKSSPIANPTVKSLFVGRENFPYLSDATPHGEAPYYMAPNRNWGFDVALLSQNPDLFAQRFVIPATDPPNEYYREVSRDDLWVQTLLCSIQDKATATDGFDSPPSIKIDGTTKDFRFAVPKTERSNCQF